MAQHLIVAGQQLKGQLYTPAGLAAVSQVVMVKAKPASSSRPTRPTKEETKAEVALRKQAKEKAKEEKKADEALHKQLKKDAAKLAREGQEKKRLAAVMRAAASQAEELAAASRAAEERRSFWANVMPRWEAHAAAQPQQPDGVAFSEWVNRRARMQGVADPWADFS